MTNHAHDAIVKSIRKPRSISATDDEWSAVQQRADHLGIPISRFIIQAVLRDPVSDDEQTSSYALDLAALQYEILREVLIQTMITRDNMKARNDDKRFNAIARKIDARIEARIAAKLD